MASFTLCTKAKPQKHTHLVLRSAQRPNHNSTSMLASASCDEMSKPAHRLGLLHPLRNCTDYNSVLRLRTICPRAASQACTSDVVCGQDWP
eukprot:66924-Pelagomonas_calceolata.AAC.10